MSEGGSRALEALPRPSPRAYPDSPVPDAPAPLRPLRAVPVTADREPPVALHDPLGVAPAGAGTQVVLSPAEWAVARAFDGRREFGELSRLGAERDPSGGWSEVRVRGLAERLQAGLLLAEPGFERAFEASFEAFRRLDARPAAGAGSEYSADAFELRMAIGGLVADDWDMPPLPHARAVLTPASPLGEMAPLYSRAWAAVRHAREEIARVCVLANLEAPLEPLVVPLAKPFDTPLGRVPCDTEALARLGLLPGRTQLAHLHARAIERQVLFCRVLFPDVPLVPLLVGSSPFAEGPETEEAVAALRALDEAEGRTLWVVASDLTRLGAGPSDAGGTGDDRRRAAVLGGATGAAIRDVDRRCLDALTKLDPEAYAELVRDEEDSRRTALAAAPYLLLRLLEKRRSLRDDEPLAGSTLGYLQSPRPGRVTTAAAVVWH